MRKRMIISRDGFTLVELIIAIAVSIIVVFGMGFVLADSVRGWHKMYDRAYADVVSDGYIARRKFDAVIRKASEKNFLLDNAGNWIEVYYYGDNDSTVIDRYARFNYESGNGEVNLEYGNWNPSDSNPREMVSKQTVCSNVSCCVFKTTGRSVQMILTLDDGSQSVAVTSSALMHNQ